MLSGNDRNPLRRVAFALTATASLLVFSLAARAQEAVRVQGQPSPDQIKAMMEAAAKAGTPPNASAAKPEEKKEGDDKKKEGEDKDKKKEEEASVKRPEKPPRVPDPRELEVKLDEHGRVPPFNFIGQPWPDVLQWLANISHASLDWQELPADYLNLTTQQSYPLDEVRDLINRHLHARGYTLLVGGEVLSVFKIEKLDPSLVPRVTEDELYDRKPYDFVKVSFQLPEGMEVEKAKEDVKQVLSPNAKVFPLVTTKRILVIDAVANQRLVSALLNEERAVADGLERPRVFKLRYARAEKVVDAIYVLFGLDPKSRPTQMDLQIEQQRLQLMMQMQQQGKDVTSMLKKDGPAIYLAVNRQTNSVLANAPAEYMRTIEKAIKAMDVPASGAETAAPGETAIAPGDTLRLEKYQLASMDPGALQLSLEEIGNLDPRTQLQADAKSKTLFARATDADHKKIAAMKDQLDGTGRQLKVIWLPKRLPADEVAGSIYNLMTGQDEEEEQPQRPFWYFDYRQQRDDKPKKGFRVDADLENNRILLWANDAELEQVKQFLAELTQDSPGEKGPRPVRVIAPVGDEETSRLLDQLRKAWPGIGGNDLIIDDQRRAPDGEDTKPVDDAKQSDEDKQKPTTPDKDHSAANKSDATHWRLDSLKDAPTQFAQYRLVANDTPVDEGSAPTSDDEAKSAPPEQSARGKRPPVTITVTKDGRLIVTSQDNVALDRLEDFVDELSSPNDRFKIFRLDHVKAYDVYLNLTEYYEDELKGETEPLMNIFGEVVGENRKKEKHFRLSSRRKLRIIYDPPSNSILVANASPTQLQEIGALIKEYDQPTEDSTKVRHNGVIKVRYSRASTIAAAIKDVYRDLLSSRDKEFDSKDKKQQGANRESITVIRFNNGGENGGPKKTAPIKIGFEGALSIGTDDVANMVIVSAQEEIYDSVVEMIHRLDEEARPRTTVYVHPVKGQIDVKSLQKALSETLATPWPGGRPEKQAAPPPAEKKEKPKEGEGPGEGGPKSGD